MMRCLLTLAMVVTAPGWIRAGDKSVIVGFHRGPDPYDKAFIRGFLKFQCLRRTLE